MKLASILTPAALWIVTVTLCSAQMSTYPAPPPLAPPSDNGAGDFKTGSPFPPAVGSPTVSAVPPSSDTPAPAPAAPASTPSTTPGVPGVPATQTAPTTTAAGLSSMSALDDKTTLEAGDTISFRVIEDRDVPVSRVVTDTGEVDFPYIGRVKVEGKTCHQVAVEVKKLLEVDYYKRATVIVGLDLIIGQDKTKAKEMAWVVGQVREVGPLELTKVQPITVSQAIMRAGGFGEFADQRRVKLIHRSGQSATEGQPANLSKAKDFQLIDVKSVFDGKSTSDPVLTDGDYIIVPKQFVNF
jgi:protein involved in polysaccharide export with SLBB domain